MKVTTYDQHSGRPTGTLDIPDDVIQAAQKVRRWMEQQKALSPRHWEAVSTAPQTLQLLGLQLVD